MSTRVSKLGGRRLVAAALAAGLTVSGITLASAPAGAAVPISQSAARFLSGTIGNTSLDTLAAIKGEGAVNPGNAGPNANSLNVSLLNNAIQLPFQQGLQLPGLGAIQLGAVNQYAAANGNGSALGASGAVDSNGGVGVGGSNGVPTGGATVDLSGLQGAQNALDPLIKLKLGIGAVTARAEQAPFHAALTDPSASCVNGGYSRVSNDNQAGLYNIAGIGLDLDSPLLSSVATQLFNTLGTTLGQLQTTLNTLLGKLVTINGLPDAQSIGNALHVNVAGGSINVSLDGGIHIDIAGLLSFLGLDLNKLCPNTSLLPYVATGLTNSLGTAIQDLLTSLVGNLTDALGHVTLKVGGTTVPIVGTVLSALNTLATTLGTQINGALPKLNLQALQPLIAALTQHLLDIRVNGQNESGGTFTETALELKILPGTSTPIPTAKAAAAALPTGVDLSLAKAAVGPSNEPPSTPPGTNIPTGVPAGQANTGSPVAPLALLVVGLFMAGGGALAWRLRGRHSA